MKRETSQIAGDGTGEVKFIEMVQFKYMELLSISLVKESVCPDWVIGNCAKNEGRSNG